MHKTIKLSELFLTMTLLLSLSVLVPPPAAAVSAQDAQPSAAKAVSFLGTVQTINGRLLTVKSDAGATMQVTIQEDARLLRIEPGQKSLQGASSLSLTDLEVGDRVLARGVPSQDGKQLAAAMLVAIKKADIALTQEKEREEWQNGVGGLVKSVDPAQGTITISTLGKAVLTIQTSPSTILRRYAPGSVKFDEAKAAPLSEVKPGDQLRARGVKSASGDSFAAQEIVSGSFRNIAGTIAANNAAASTLTVIDLANKHPVVIRITPDTELKKLDPTVAQRIALRLKPAAPGRPRNQHGTAQPDQPPAIRPGEPLPDPQQILARAPSVPLKDFVKGSAVMLVATDGPPSGPVTAITVVGGVEPMLQASASGSQAMLSSSWNLGGQSGGDSSGEEAPQ